jgi:hypothetical protein
MRCGSRARCGRARVWGGVGWCVGVGVGGGRVALNPLESKAIIVWYPFRGKSVIQIRMVGKCGLCNFKRFGQTLLTGFIDKTLPKACIRGLP